MSDCTVVACAWGANRYADAASALRERCAQLGYAHHIEMDLNIALHMACQFGAEWDDRQWAYRVIPQYIQRVRYDLQGPLLYVHADMRIREPIPEGAFDGMDVGLESGWSQRPPRPDDRVLASPIYLADTRAARRFLALWVALCRYLDDGMGEHNQLLRVWRLMTDKDRSARIEIFDPPLGSIRADSDVPLVGTK